MSVDALNPVATAEKTRSSAAAKGSAASGRASRDKSGTPPASNVGTPVLALFGPTVRQFGFFPYNAHASVVERNLDCRPCSSHGTEECPLEHHLCMREILPDMVMATLTRTLA